MDFHAARTRGCSCEYRQKQDCKRGLNVPGKSRLREDELNTEAWSKSAKVQARQGGEAGPEMRSEMNLASQARDLVASEGQSSPPSERGDSISRYGAEEYVPRTKRRMRLESLR